MSYIETYHKLTNISFEEDHIELDNLDIFNLSFHSDSHKLLPGNNHYTCDRHQISFDEEDHFLNDVGSADESVYIKDFNIEENKDFRYHIFKPKSTQKARKVIFLFHGFNEKNWEKYMPWAKTLAEKTGKTIVMFPIAFHMNRAPQSWSEKRQMYALSKERKKHFPNVIDSSLFNVAISMRLHAMPQRFIWSGLQTYYDVIQLIEDCKSGKHELIDPEFEFDIFAYSIGCLLTEILKLSNYKSYFSNTKVCMFCGGAAFNRLSPVSKFILDSEANVALYSFLVEHIKNHMKKDKRLKHFMEDHIEGKIFHSMLDYRLTRDFREDLFRKYEDQILAITLKKDEVIPSYEIINTLQGACRDINIPVEVYDFPFKYSHEAPFPLTKSNEEEIDYWYNLILDRACDFLK